MSLCRRWRPKNVYSKVPEKISFYPQNFLVTFLVIENCNKISTQQQWNRLSADTLSAAAASRRSIKVGGDAHKLSAAAAHGSNIDMLDYYHIIQGIF